MSHIQPGDKVRVTYVYEGTVIEGDESRFAIHDDAGLRRLFIPSAPGGEPASVERVQ